jgi:hypothetical protein
MQESVANRKQAPLLRFDDRAIKNLRETDYVTDMENQHEANFVLDYLSGPVGVRYRLYLAAF